MNSRPYLSLLGVLVLLGGGSAAAGQLPQRHPAPVPLAGSAAVVGAAAVCPDLRQDRTVLRTRVSAGVSRPDSTTEAVTVTGGSIVAQPLRAQRREDGGAPAHLPIDRPGQVAVDLGGNLNGDALVVTARGALAAGLELEQVTRGQSGAERGLAGLRCRAPATQAWFVGGSTRVGDATLLVLANPDDTPALVDVTVWTGDGPVDPRPGRGIAVPPRSRAAVPVDILAPDKDLLALHVVAQRGRVVAALRHARYDGHTSRGVEWVPQALPPATTVVVPGLPRGPGRRIVQVTNPGPDTTVVSLQMTTATAQFVPTGLDALRVPPGTTVATDVTELTNPTPLAVTVTSAGGPVLAGAFVYDSQGTSRTKEFAYAGSALPLRGSALITDLVIDRPTESTLLLSAPTAGAAVDVTPVPVVGVPGPLPDARRVDVPAGRTVELKLSTFLPPGATGRLAVDVAPVPGSGPVYAARYLRERGDTGPLTTILELQGAAQRVALPVVRRDPLVGTSR